MTQAGKNHVEQELKAFYKENLFWRVNSGTVLYFPNLWDHLCYETIFLDGMINCFYAYQIYNLLVHLDLLVEVEFPRKVRWGHYLNSFKKIWFVQKQVFVLTRTTYTLTTQSTGFREGRCNVDRLCWLESRSLRIRNVPYKKIKSKIKKGSCNLSTL